MNIALAWKNNIKTYCRCKDFYRDAFGVKKKSSLINKLAIQDMSILEKLNSINERTAVIHFHIYFVFVTIYWLSMVWLSIERCINISWCECISHWNSGCLNCHPLNNTEDSPFYLIWRFKYSLLLFGNICLWTGCTMHTLSNDEIHFVSYLFGSLYHRSDSHIQTTNSFE